MHDTYRCMNSSLRRRLFVGIPALFPRAMSGVSVSSSVARGAFIVFEGLDRSGKTTQIKLLQERLLATGRKVESFRFPDRTTTIGKMIDAYLRSGIELDDHTVHLLFSANRWELQESIRAHLLAGTHVVCDRYAFSGVAFTGAKGLDQEWCWAPDKGLPAPDLCVYLRVDAEEAKTRGEYGEERYENVAMQTTVKGLFDQMNEQFDFFSPVDANQSIEAVSAAIDALVAKVVKDVVGKPVATLEPVVSNQ